MASAIGRFDPSLRRLRVSLLLVLASGLVALGARWQREDVLVVGTSLENFRDEPNGNKLGSLAQGTEIERLDQDGQWVRFRVEGWIWGPSLKGFESMPEEETEERQATSDLPLQDNLPRIKRLINEKYGVFYGVDLDQDEKCLIVRFRVQAIDRQTLEQRQMAVQREALALFDEEARFDAVRVETNRPDGSGRVGGEIARTAVGDIRRFGAGPAEEWKNRTLISTDGGKTWNR
jgi:hypothetical protein